MKYGAVYYYGGASRQCVTLTLSLKLALRGNMGINIMYISMLIFFACCHILNKQ